MEKQDALNPNLVSEFVRNAHGNFDRVQELLAQEPALLNAAWDWGGGDWETALGAASHMGRKDIALFLIEKGARIDIFAAVMLGQVKIVQSILSAYPHLLYSKGPHGIPLLSHAKAGGDEANPFYNCSNSLVLMVGTRKCDKSGPYDVVSRAFARISSTTGALASA